MEKKNKGTITELSAAARGKFDECIILIQIYFIILEFSFRFPTQSRKVIKTREKSLINY